MHSAHNASELALKNIGFRHFQHVSLRSYHLLKKGKSLRAEYLHPGKYGRGDGTRTAASAVTANWFRGLSTTGKSRDGTASS